MILKGLCTSTQFMWFSSWMAQHFAMPQLLVGFLFIVSMVTLEPVDMMLNIGLVDIKDRSCVEWLTCCSDWFHICLITVCFSHVLRTKQKYYLILLLNYSELEVSYWTLKQELPAWTWNWKSKASWSTTSFGRASGYQEQFRYEIAGTNNHLFVCLSLFEF